MILSKKNNAQQLAGKIVDYHRKHGMVLGLPRRIWMSLIRGFLRDPDN